MTEKLIKVAIIGKTNAGKSTLINSFVGEKISIINKKINTTKESILGVKNIGALQIIFYDTPGSNFLKTTDLSQKNFKINIWQAIDTVDLVAYLIDVNKYNYEIIKADILKISEAKKNIVLIFNKIDLIDSKKILPYIDELKNLSELKDFFLISAKYNRGTDHFIEYLSSNSYKNNWIFTNNEITDKDDIYISSECTRNAVLEFTHQEVPYNIEIINTSFKFLKNNQLKIKQSIQLKNARYKPIIIGKDGQNIKKIREKSQVDIEKILNCKVHLYIQVIFLNEK